MVKEHGYYVPAAGDIVWLDFTPALGSEQRGRRPTLVLSRQRYNRIGLAVVCPITSKVKGIPFEVALPSELPIQGVVLADHAHTFDWKKRNVEYANCSALAVAQDVVLRRKTLFAI